jgi:hypothetical protein
MHEWTHQPDGSRVRVTNGIRIVDRTTPRADNSGVEHLVTWQDGDGDVVVVELDDAGLPVSMTTMPSSD